MDPFQPHPGFHFLVEFVGFTKSAQDTRFQSVTGLSATMETESYAEGGENRFTHQLPTKTNYENLELKRGLMQRSEVTDWCRDAIERFQFKPVNLIVSLLDEKHKPAASWQVVHAIPVSWSVSDFDAEQSTLAVETLRLQYHYFTSLKS